MTTGISEPIARGIAIAGSAATAKIAVNCVISATRVAIDAALRRCEVTFSMTSQPPNVAATRPTAMISLYPRMNPTADQMKPTGATTSPNSAIARRRDSAGSRLITANPARAIDAAGQQLDWSHGPRSAQTELCSRGGTFGIPHSGHLWVGPVQS